VIYIYLPVTKETILRRSTLSAVNSTRKIRSSSTGS